MEIPELFEIINLSLLDKWRKEIEKNDECAYYKRQRELKYALQESLDGENLNLLMHYEAAAESCWEYLNYEMSKRLVLFGIKAGMDMQKAFDEED